MEYTGLHVVVPWRTQRAAYAAVKGDSWEVSCLLYLEAHLRMPAVFVNTLQDHRPVSPFRCLVCDRKRNACLLLPTARV